MRENDGRKLDHATLERLRIRAVQAVEAGEHPEDVARAMGMARGTVFMWLAKYREGGLGALKARPVPGKPAKLDATAMRRLQALIAGSDPADEAGIRSDYHAGTTWAPVGVTAVVKATGARHSINMISAVSAQGLLRFAVFHGTCTAGVFIGFAKKLLADTDGPVYLIVDGHPTHKAKATKAFVASTGGRLKLFVLPAYSPQLNPDEWVWKHVKHDRIARTSVTGADDLKAKAISALRRLQKLPALVRAFFADPNLRYITT